MRVVNYFVQSAEAARLERERIDELLALDYACGAAYCDDLACREHSPYLAVREPEEA